MTIQVTNINQSTDTFGQWLSKTNQLLTFANNLVVSTNSNTAVGSAGITGTFTANIVLANNTLRVGGGTSNIIANGTSLVIRTSATQNAIYTSNGFIIDAATQYSKFLMKMGNTEVRSNTITSDYSLVRFGMKVGASGNTFLNTSSVTTDRLNVKTMNIQTNVMVGFTEANTYIDKYGIQIFDAPAGVGTAVVNSKMTATTLWIRNIFANTITANSINVSGPMNINTVTSNVTFIGNTNFRGQNNHFEFGLTANTRIGIGPLLRTPLAPLHIYMGPVTGAQVPSTKAGILIDSNVASYIEFRSPSNSSRYSGLYFADATHGGYLVYKSGGPDADSNRMFIGATTAIELGIGSGTGTDEINKRTPIAVATTSGFDVVGRISFTNGSSTVNLTANPSGGGTYIFPSNTGTAGQLLTTNGTGTLTWGTPPPPIPPITTNLQINSLGVGTPASGVTGEIRATNNITGYYSSDKKFKENVKKIANPLEKIRRLDGVEFDWTDEYIKEHGGEDGYFVRKNDIGVIAQQLQEVLPQLVAERQDGSLAAKYDRITALLIECVKALDEEVQDLRSRLKD